MTIIQNFEMSPLTYKRKKKYTLYPTELTEYYTVKICSTVLMTVALTLAKLGLRTI